MAKVLVDDVSLREQATKIRKYKTEHETAMKKIETLVHSLDGIFKGESQVAFVSEYDKMKPTFVKFAELIENYAKELELAANAFTSTDQEVAKKIRNS